MPRLVKKTATTKPKRKVGGSAASASVLQGVTADVLSARMDSIILPSFTNYVPPSLNGPVQTNEIVGGAKKKRVAAPKKKKQAGGSSGAIPASVYANFYMAMEPMAPLSKINYIDSSLPASYPSPSFGVPSSAQQGGKKKKAVSKKAKKEKKGK